MTIHRPLRMSQGLTNRFGGAMYPQTHWGTVLAVSQGSVTVTIDGDTTPVPVDCIQGYNPQVGDFTLLLQPGSNDTARSNLIAVGPVGQGIGTCCARTFLNVAANSTSTLAAITSGYQSTPTAGAFTSNPAFFTLLQSGIQINFPGFYAIGGHVDALDSSGGNWSVAAGYVGGTAWGPGSRGETPSNADDASSFTDVVQVTEAMCPAMFQLGTRSSDTTTTTPGAFWTYLSITAA